MSDRPPSAVQRVCMVDAGVIGAGWAARYLAHGLEVAAVDPAPGAEGRLRAAVDRAWPALQLPWTKLQAPPLTHELAARLVEGTQAQAAGRSVEELERRRDDFLVRLLQLVREYWPPDEASWLSQEDGNDER